MVLLSGVSACGTEEPLKGTKMTAGRYEKVLHGVESVLSRPNEILIAVDPTHDEKIELLRQWRRTCTNSLLLPEMA